MFHDEPVFIGVLTVLSVLVVALLGVIVVLSKSLRDGKKKKVVASSKPAAAKSKPPAKAAAAKGRGTLDSTPEITIGEATIDEALLVVPPVEPVGKLVSAVDGDLDDVTRVSSREAVKGIPRLSGGEIDDEESGPGSIEESIAKLLYDSEAEIDIDEPTGPNDVILVSAMGQTDRGVARRRNEDAYVIDTNLQLYAVADGMGGYAGGDVASRLAVQEIWTAMKSPDQLETEYKDRPRRGRELIAAVERANEAVYTQSLTTRALKGMGTTVVAARFSPKKQRMYVAHVGDSRCYRFRRGELQMLTTDHTLAARGIAGPMGQNVSRAVGIGKKVKIDLIVDKPLPEDIFLLCTDGLPKMVTDEHIRRILASNEGALDRAAAQLVLAANAEGGRDNITVVLVRILEVTTTMRTASLVKAQKRVEFGPS